jgi:eukaryotic-like serine/threonine-protein kinase
MELAVAADVGMAVSEIVVGTHLASAKLAAQTTFQMLAFGVPQTMCSCETDPAPSHSRPTLPSASLPAAPSPIHRKAGDSEPQPVLQSARSLRASSLEGRMGLAAGSRLGPYEIQSPIGAGGMGEVYKARDTRLDRSVAIKVLPPEVSTDPDRRARFEREAKTIAGLSHPHICTLYDVGEHDSSTFLVMEHLQGQTLADRLAKGPLPLEQALTVATEIADALSAAHRQGVIHRDLKPGNVMLTKAGAKLLDFGLAKLTAHGEHAAAASLASAPTQTRPLTSEGAIVGTLQYMAPEQVEGKPADARTDLWALGAVLYEMLTGNRAFAGDTAASLIGNIMNAEPPALATLQPLAPPALDRLVRQCLAKSPDDRPDTAHDVGNDLRWLRESRGLDVRVHVPPRRSRWWRLTLVGGTAVVVTAGALFVLRPGRHVAEHASAVPIAAAHDRTAIAVLPPQNLDPDGPNAYFAGGLHDELLTQLAKVASLKVISRTSVMGYQGTTKPLKQIADELGVGSIVEGSVQVVNGRLRVSVQLIDAATDQHLWAERYDRTLDDAFAIQSEVARQIVTAVGAALSSDEKGRLSTAPTANAEAYRLYLQGREFWLRPGYLRENLEIAQQLYERALALDPSFALARAAVSRVHGLLYWFRYDPSPGRAERQRQEAETALRLAPDLPQAHLAMGAAHYFGGRWSLALDEYSIAQKGLPNDAEILAWVAYVHRRLGHWSEVFAAYEKAAQLNPRDANLYHDLGGMTYTVVHRYADAVRAFDRALSLAPDMNGAAVDRGWAYVRWQGQFGPLREVLTRLPAVGDLGDRGTVASERAALLLHERNADGMLQELQHANGETFEGQNFFLPRALYAAWAHELRGDHALARAALKSALMRMDAAARDLPGDWRVHAARGLALAGLGRRDEAVDEARWLQQSEVYRNDAFQVTYVAEDRARILAQAGDADAGLDEIERLLTGPSWLSVHTLRLDPRWNPIRNHPRFKALLAKYSASEAR